MQWSHVLVFDQNATSFMFSQCIAHLAAIGMLSVISDVLSSLGYTTFGRNHSWCHLGSVIMSYYHI